MIDMMSPKKKLNGEGGLLCLWASPGPFKSAILAYFSIWRIVSDFDAYEVEKASVKLVNANRTAQ